MRRLAPTASSSEGRADPWQTAWTSGGLHRGWVHHACCCYHSSWWEIPHCLEGFLELGSPGDHRGPAAA